MKFSKVHSDFMNGLQLNAGMLLTDFDISAGTYDEDDIVGATTGGITISMTPSFSDMGDGVDNCPANTIDLKRIDDWNCTISGTFVTIDTASAKLLLAAADIGSGSDETKVTPRNYLNSNDFITLWWIGDYTATAAQYSESDLATKYVAVKMTGALSTGGFSIKSTDKGKGNFAFTFTAHRTIAQVNAGTIPVTFYAEKGA